MSGTWSSNVAVDWEKSLFWNEYPVEIVTARSRSRSRSRFLYLDIQKTLEPRSLLRYLAIKRLASEILLHAVYTPPNNVPDARNRLQGDAL